MCWNLASWTNILTLETKLRLLLCCSKKNFVVPSKTIHEVTSGMPSFYVALFLSLDRIVVSILVGFSIVFIFSRCILHSSNTCLIQWYFKSMCLVFECSMLVILQSEWCFQCHNKTHTCLVLFLSLLGIIASTKSPCKPLL